MNIMFGPHLALAVLTASLTNYTGTCKVHYLGQDYVTACSLMDMTTSDFWNRWQIVLHGRYLEARPRYAELVRAELTAEGGDLHTMPLLGNVEIIPGDSSIRTRYLQIYQEAPKNSFEVRAQNVTVEYQTVGNDIVTVITFDEPRNETDGLATPYVNWQERFVESLKLYGHQKQAPENGYGTR